MKKRILFYTLTLFCALCSFAQNPKPDYSIRLSNQEILEQYFIINSDGRPHCTTGKTTIMITSVPHKGNVDCPPSKYFKIMTNRFIQDNNLINDVVFLFANLTEFNLESFNQITDNKITKRAPYILIYDKNGKLCNWHTCINIDEFRNILETELKPSQNNSQGGNPTNKNTHGAVSNPLVTKQVKSADDFLEMYKNLIGLPYDFRNSNITEIKSYCRSNGYYFSDKGYYIQISNPVTKIFGQNFEVRIHELDVNLNGVGKPSKMYLEWYSTPYFSYEKMNSEFKNFTDEIERCGGILQGYDETCHRSIYKFPNGIEIRTKAWDEWKRIQMFVFLPYK